MIFVEFSYLDGDSPIFLQKIGGKTVCILGWFSKLRGADFFPPFWRKKVNVRASYSYLLDFTFSGRYMGGI